MHTTTLDNLPPPQEHIQEIFSTYGKIKMVEMPMNRLYPHLSKGYAYVEFESSDEAEKALKHMNGGGLPDASISQGDDG